MKLIKTKITGLKILKTKIFKDKRGFLKEIFRKEVVNDEDFLFDIYSSSKKNVLRGLHIQTKNPQAKIITVTHGRIFDVAVDLRKKSKTYGKYFGIIISDNDDFSFYIPAGFAHGFVCLSTKCTVYYKNSKYRSPNFEVSVAWNDTDLNIKWPLKNPVLSSKDKNGLSFKDFKKLYR
ncbi:dTDP-4-dehydrorhamnose 3,5-epimerase [Candidatus Pelagibacter ubique]|uniref:dTDP-4-dehydrorhamnose 3,5-epimerase n=1 Tax=Pelagibacter ubique TaxID=198252 RepID=A0ABX1T3J5_PELUQ|nr:dTDP-4-dehydrorhamnose 3,5-epimerase [Candidatus Pelagibacter ubique]NMN67999.1 dTDP-4-dehydrorhamnose 3,5-epimerase [Candidatus Pelagibacter ubique]